MKCFCSEYILYTHTIYIIICTYYIHCKGPVFHYGFFLYPFNRAYSDNISLSLYSSSPFRYFPIKWTLSTEFLGRPQILFVASGTDLNGDLCVFIFLFNYLAEWWILYQLLLNLNWNNWFREFRTLKRVNLWFLFCFSSITVNKN